MLTEDTRHAHSKADIEGYSPLSPAEHGRHDKLSPVEDKNEREPSCAVGQVTGVSAVGMVTAGAGGRQPNFLQKLYDFLALDPHPCPEVIYWAADSKQLVIAQPDELARNVLPKLFKHDKIASFGRQLNIYGFAIVYPGRQFKDEKGNVLDASVWAHPTLHRCSTPDDIINIKRRAAPKLFRTRKLANGRVVRTRAGPEVERKFYEIKEVMESERERKNRGGAGAGRTGGWGSDRRSVSTRMSEQPSQQGEHRSGSLTRGGRRMSVDTHLAGHSSPSTCSPTSPSFANGYPRMSGTPMTAIPMEQRVLEQEYDEAYGYGHAEGYHEEQEGWGFRPSYKDQQPHAQVSPQALSSITEGIPMLLGHDTHKQQYPQQHYPLQMNMPMQTQAQSNIFPSTPSTPAPPNPHIVGLTESYPPAPMMGRFYRSCPASIHTSPVLFPRILTKVHGHDQQQIQAFPPSFVPSPQPLSHHQRLSSALGLKLDTQTQVQLTMPQQQPRIAAPAAIDPFASQRQAQIYATLDSNPTDTMSNAIPASSYTVPQAPRQGQGYVDLQSSPASYTVTLLDGVWREGSVYPAHHPQHPAMKSWERTGSIDPRWVSPRGSAWNTPAVTPRSGSPVDGRQGQ